MQEDKITNVGIGFATGRRSFQKVLNTYVYNWCETELSGKEDIRLSLLVAYDLKYSNTRIEDFTRISRDVRDVIANCFFAAGKDFEKEISRLTDDGIISEKEAKLVFGSGYAGKRNAILYMTGDWDSTLAYLEKMKTLTSDGESREVIDSTISEIKLYLEADI